MNAEFLPCPFCGSNDIQVVRGGDNRRSCIIGCGDCGCTLETNEIGSGRLWNQRAKTIEAAATSYNISVMPCPFHRVGELCFLKNLAGCSMEACLIHRARA